MTVRLVSLEADGRDSLAAALDDLGVGGTDVTTHAPSQPFAPGPGLTVLAAAPTELGDSATGETARPAGRVFDVTGLPPATTTGTTVVPAGVPDALSLLLAVRAAERLDDVAELRATWRVARPRGGWGRNDRAAVRAAVLGGANAVVAGRPVTEELAAHRWLAWFPRPVGPRHAVNVPSGTMAVVPQVLDGLELARAHLALHTWQAELVQAAGNLARTEAGRRLLDRWVEAGSRHPGDDARWACVVELVDRSDHLVRAWAHGTARRATSHRLVAHLDAVVAGDVANWCVGPTAGAVLDALADATDLRWSVTEPDRIGVVDRG